MMTPKTLCAETTLSTLILRHGPPERTTLLAMKTKLQRLQLVTAGVLAILITQPSAGQSWSLTGNTGTAPATNFVGTTDNKPLVLRTNNVERMRVLQNGRVGIGTTVPSALFNVKVNDNVSLSTTDNFLLGATNNFNIAFDNNEIQARSNGAGSPLYLNYWGGSVWVGNHNGSAIPAIFANSNGSVGVGNSTTQTGFALTVNPAAFGGIYINDPAGGNVLLCTKSGNTGEALRVNISSTTNPNAAIRGHTDGNGFGVLAEATGQVGFGMEAYSSHSYGLWAGTGNSNTYAAFFSGNVYCTGNYLGSDQQLKENIQDSSAGINVVNQLRPKQYRYRQDGIYQLMNLPQGNHYGLTAQDVEKILPDLVKDTRFEPAGAVLSSEGDGLQNSEGMNFKALNYTELIPILIKAIQEQQQEIEELKRLVETRN